MTPQAPAPGPRQIAVYRVYLHLQSIVQALFSASLAGHLVLSIGFGRTGAELALAAIIAGGAFLGIEPDPQNLKTAVRHGACDFMVNTLDEALRVLKNELRKHTPLSAGLLGDPAAVLPEIVERGVQPDLIAAAPDTPALQAPLHTLIERGACKIAFQELEYPERLAGQEAVWTAQNPQDMRRLDRIALDAIPPEDSVRRRWLEQAPKSFHRQIPLERVLQLNEAESARLLELFKSATSLGEFDAPVGFRWLDAKGVGRTFSLRRASPPSH